MTAGSKALKSGSLSSTGVLKAIPRVPNKTACLAAARVPECQVEFPRLEPRLIPERTRSAPPQRCSPKATQSEGVPLTRKASKFLRGVFRNESGRLARSEERPCRERV